MDTGRGEGGDGELWGKDIPGSEMLGVRTEMRGNLDGEKHPGWCCWWDVIKVGTVAGEVNRKGGDVRVFRACCGFNFCSGRAWMPSAMLRLVGMTTGLQEQGGRHLEGLRHSRGCCGLD